MPVRFMLGALQTKRWERDRRAAPPELQTSWPYPLGLAKPHATDRILATIIGHL